jgi:hypothetical protein
MSDLIQRAQEALANSRPVGSKTLQTVDGDKFLVIPADALWIQKYRWYLDRCGEVSRVGDDALLRDLINERMGDWYEGFVQYCDGNKRNCTRANLCYRVKWWPKI